MKVLELFAGTRSIGRAFAGGGHDVYSIEWDDSFPDILVHGYFKNHFRRHFRTVWEA